METIIKQFEEELKEIKSVRDLNELKVKYLGKKGIVSELTSNMKDLNVEEKKKQGQIYNEIKIFVSLKIEQMEEKYKSEELNRKLSSEKIDISLPSTKIKTGSAHIIENIIEELEELLMSMGYDVVEGPELEQDLYNFELLNLPKGHPARDAQDTFYTEGDALLLRSQTSPVQIRTMLANEEKTPIRIICPGKTYRRDSDDATHSHQFTQMEGLLVDKNITLADLKGTFDIIARSLFGEETLTRFRPSYYPFTEPSVELDISCFNCKGEGCHICKTTGWITVGGAGIVHHNVLDNCGYDSNIWSGFAFGFGVERLAMLKYQIPDIRTFFTNDLRIKEFDRRGDK